MVAGVWSIAGCRGADHALSMVGLPVPEYRRSTPASPLLADVAAVWLVVAGLIQLSGRLPPWPLAAVAALIAGGVLAAVAGWRHRPPGRAARVVVSLLVAVACLGWRIEMALDARLDPRLEGQMLRLDVMIDRLADRGRFGDRLLAVVKGCEPLPSAVAPASVGSAPRCNGLDRVQLGWSLERGRDRDDTATARWPRPGERWQIEGRARRPAAPVNPGSFDLELRMLEEGIGAIVRVGARTRLDDPSIVALWLSAPAIAIERWRDSLREAVEARAAAAASPGGRPPWPSLALVNALSIGDQRGLTAADWALFSRTGVSHLMAISGMHVTLLAAVGGLIVSRLLTWLGNRGLAPVRWLLRRVGRPRVVLATTVVLAFGYALLSGWGIASQRTCWMLLAASIASATFRASGPIRTTLVATLPILVIDPWAVGAAGFWLSFGAVVAIIWQAGGQPIRPPRAGRVATLKDRVVEVIGSQWAATIALLPLTIALFASASVVGPLVNLVAIPWISLVITPAALGLTLAAPLPWPAWLPLDPWQPAWQGLDAAIGLTMMLLRWVDSGSLASIRLAAPTPALLGAALLGAGWLLAPRGSGRRWLGVAGLLPLLFAGPRLVPPDHLRIQAFDIGFGSAVLVEAAGARILIDSGGGEPGPDGPGPASRSIVPVLAARGIDRIDVLVVSHRDREHAGGTATIVGALKPTWLVAAFDPRWLPIDVGAIRWQPCTAGQRLDIGPIALEMLWPERVAAHRVEAGDNGRSCVVRLVHPSATVVAAGDLPMRLEKRMVDALPMPDALAATVLVVPGQGSRAAAGERLLAAAMPRIALIQTARAQRQRVVATDVVVRLERVGARVLRTDQDGAITVVIEPATPTAAIEPATGRARGGPTSISESASTSGPISTPESTPTVRVERARRDSAPYWRITEADEGGTDDADDVTDGL